MIEICSRHKGPVNVTTRDGRPVKVDFRDVSGRGPANGFAEVEESVAEVLLGIGKPDYWRPGEMDVVTESQDAGKVEGQNADNEGSPGGNEGQPLSTETYANIRNVNDLKAALETCDDQGVLMELIALEAQREKTRESWMDALNARLEALQQG